MTKEQSIRIEAIVDRLMELGRWRDGLFAECFEAAAEQEGGATRHQRRRYADEREEEDRLLTELKSLSQSLDC